MKKCPYCAEEIQDEAVKCRYCHEYVDGRVLRGPKPAADDALPFYLKTSFIVVAFLMVPPFALPSVWLHPKLALGWKLGITVLVVATTWLSVIAFMGLAQQMAEATKMLNDLGY